MEGDYIFANLLKYAFILKHGNFFKKQTCHISSAISEAKLWLIFLPFLFSFPLGEILFPLCCILCYSNDSCGFRKLDIGMLFSGQVQKKMAIIHHWLCAKIGVYSKILFIWASINILELQITFWREERGCDALGILQFPLPSPQILFTALCMNSAVLDIHAHTTPFSQYILLKYCKNKQTNKKCWCDCDLQ